MCGRYALVNTGELAQRFQATQGALKLAPHYNMAPSQLLPIILRNSPNRLVMMKWGLIPFWAKEPKASYSTINARAEGLEFKPTYRKPIRTQRCLVPADGFYEWRKLSLTSKKPYFIRLHNQALFSFAGLYDIYKGANGLELYTFTIITTTANELMAPIHERMPVILSPSDEALWLNPAITDPTLVTPLLRPFPAELMEAFPVSAMVNSPANDSPAIIQPVPEL